MNLTVLLSHSADTRISSMLRLLHEQAKARRLASFASIVITGEPDPEAHLWESEWSRETGDPMKMRLLTGLAELGTIRRLRLVALGAAVDDEVARHVGRAMEILERSSRTVIGASTEISTARIGIVGRQEERPVERFFSRLANHNLLVLPYDRLDDAAAADAIVADDTQRFAVHGAAEIGALCGLWAPMDRAPVDKGQLGPMPTGELGIRLVQSRVRSLHAPTVSLHELFGERLPGLPVPSRYTEIEKLSGSQIDALASALVDEVKEFHFDPRDLTEDEYAQGKLLSILFRSARAAIKEIPDTVRSVVRGELRMVVSVALQNIVAPRGEVKVVDNEATNRLDTGRSGRDGSDPWAQSRLRESLPEVSGEVWTKLVDRVFATIGGDPSADDIREQALGGADRVPVGRKDILEGMERLPGSLPRLALGDEQVTLIGRARASGLDKQSTHAAPPSADDLFDALTRDWHSIIAHVGAADERIGSALEGVVAYDWSGNVLTLIHAQGSDGRSRRRLEATPARAILVDALKDTVGHEPAVFNWIADESEFTRIVLPTARGSKTASEGGGNSGGTSQRSGLLMRIGDLILEERRVAERRLEALAEDLRVAAEGFAEHVVNPVVYIVMALGFAGLLFESLTSPLGELALDVLPEDVGTGALYAPIILSMAVIALLLTNFAISIGWQLRFVFGGVSYAALIGLVVRFDVTFERRELLVLHTVIAALLIIAWWQTSESEAQLRWMLTRISGVSYGILIIVILAILQNRGGGPLSQIQDPQTVLRVSQLILRVSQVAVIAPFIVLLVVRVRLRFALQRSQRSSAWMTEEYDRSKEAVEILGLAYVQWNVTACAIAQVVRRPYGPIVASEAPEASAKLEGVRRAGFADLKLTMRGTDTLRNRLRQELVQPGWLKRRYEVRVEAFLRKEADRLGISAGEVRDLRPETDPQVSTPDEIADKSTGGSRRLSFARLGDRGAFDVESSAPIADEALLELLSPVLRDPEAQRITGVSGDVPTAVAFLSQARPVSPAPQIPLDEVEDFDQRHAPVRREMSQYVWWPRFLAYPEDATEEPVEETAIRWVGGGPADGSAAVQLLAVRVDASEPFDYDTLRYGSTAEQVADARVVFRPGDGAGPVG